MTLIFNFQNHFILNYAHFRQIKINLMVSKIMKFVIVHIFFLHSELNKKYINFNYF